MGDYKKYLYCFIAAVLSLSCSPTNKPLMNDNQACEEFCSLGISHFDTLLIDVKYLLNRSGGYVIDIEGYKLMFTKQQTEICYKELSPIKDSLFWDISNNKKIFEERYPIDVQKIEELVNFCEEWKILEILIRKDERQYFFRLPAGTIFYRETEPEGYTKRICENWYFSRRE